MEIELNKRTKSKSRNPNNIMGTWNKSRLTKEAIHE